MKELFKKRRQVFLEQCFKYSRYVFNDHFVLFLLIFLAFLAMQYSQLLRNFPSNHLPVILVLVVLSIFVFPLGNIATYLEKADKHFLLTKEGDLLAWIRQASCSSFVLWGSLQNLFLLILYPVFLALGVPLWGFVAYLLLMLVAKFAVFQRKLARLLSSSRLNWDAAIQLESQRKQSILRFYALFTNVKGISNSVKRRAYLDGLLRFIPKKQEKTWTNLFLRSFLRNGELLGLSLRLFLLSLFFIIFLGNSLVASVLAILFNYLMIFQLTSLYQAYDYQYLTGLFPLESGLKKAGVQEVIRLVAGVVLLVQTILSLIVFSEKIWVLLLLLVSLFFVFGYLPFKLKRLVDE